MPRDRVLPVIQQRWRTATNGPAQLVGGSPVLSKETGLLGKFYRAWPHNARPAIAE
jgi:hypothetical protein